MCSIPRRPRLPSQAARICSGRKPLPSDEGATFVAIVTSSRRPATAQPKSRGRVSAWMSKAVTEREKIVVRFAGDSGDGMQLTGDRFTSATALLGNDLATLPDFPAEIRAPAGTVH